MGEKGMIFTGESVGAILGDRKTQTRRTVNGQSRAWEFLGLERYQIKTKTDKNGAEWPKELLGLYASFYHTAEGFHTLAKSPHDVGDTVYVKEAWRKIPPGFPVYEYRADGHPESCIPWRSPMHMPREAARVWLRITDVRVERLRDISEGDAIAEGCEKIRRVGDGTVAAFARNGFAALWDEINGKRGGCSWEDNPWVWCFAFEHLPDCRREGGGSDGQK